MSSLGSPSPFFIGGKKAYEVQRSLRFNRDDSAYLTYTPSSTSSDRKTWTWSSWVKRAALTFGSQVTIFHSYSSGGQRTELAFQTDDTLRFAQGAASSGGSLITTAKFRDPNAWYHIMCVADCSNSTAADRLKLYVNGVEQTDFGTQNNAADSNTQMPTQNVDISIGRRGGLGNHFDGYMAEINFIDGQALTPSSFAETNADTGQYNPKKYVGSYGTNGFYLNFSNNSGTTATTLGKDSSGNGNNSTPTNFSVSAGTDNDSLEDTPTNNFATLNFLKKPSTGGVIDNGNLVGSGSANSFRSYLSTIYVSSGKWFCEVEVHSLRILIGIAREDADSELNYLGYLANSYCYSDLFGKFNDGSSSSYGETYAANDVIGVALDLDNGTLIFYKNGTSQGTAFTGLSGTFAIGFSTYDNNSSASINFGQRPFNYTVPTGYQTLCSANLPAPTILLPNKHFDTTLYTGNNSSQSITSLNFKPDWLWFKSRGNTASHGLYDSMRGPNLALVSNSNIKEITASASNDLVSFDDNGFTLGPYEDVSSVNNSGLSIVNWAWNAGDADSKTFKVKVVADSTDYGHGTGSNKYQFLKSDGTTGFGTNGVDLDLEEGGTYIFDWSDSTAQSHPLRFSLTNDGTHSSGTSAGSEYTTGVTKDDSAYKTTITVASGVANLFYYCQNHSGMGAEINTNSTTGSTNFDGSTLSKVKKNLTAGFSIVRYVGTGSAETIGHGLGIAPKVVITKDHTFQNNNGVGYSWVVGTTAIDGSYDYLYLNLTNAKTDSGLSAPTSTVFSISNSVTYSRSGEGKINYCFNEVEGFSRFRSYVGNGSNSGTFVFTGFRPAWVMIKRTDSTGHWVIDDVFRSSFNEMNNTLYANLNNAEYTGGLYGIDFLSNGFKIRDNDNNYNATNNTYLYFAFAESPFKYARAR